ncbi:ATP-binding protein [Agarilytica rhodophyticola]|uniref:ATP-binding protein n=1 Tax=Agarilytica rhodophyticola TaxID=1737490 RepID=UPI000B340F06|nr:SbcC/MukB-like Walker B domain-containing protein [Agarilytica rhodophyticola]
MFCKRGIFVNWGNVPHLEFDFGPVNLFSGGNGSGKTTAADGIQSLMTAAHENLFTYNPGQDETTQRGRGGKQVRTLASYVLGCDDGSYSRLRPTDGYVAGVFHPTEGENSDVFTAVMCVRARLDNASTPRQARQDELLFLIIPGKELQLSHFVREDSGGKYVVPINEIALRLQQECGKNSVESYDKKGPYLRRLYGALRGLKGPIADREAKHAARTFSNFMAYKPVKSITEFVAREILDPKDLSEDIRQVSELMKTIHNMDEDTRQLKGAIENLENAQNLSSHYINNWIEHRTGEYCEITRQLIVKQHDYLKQKNEVRLNKDSISDIESQIRQTAEKKQLLHDQLIDLQAQRQGIDALKDKDQLERDISHNKDVLVQMVTPLLEQDQQFGKNHHVVSLLQKKLSQVSIAVDIPALESKAFQKAIKALLATPQDTGLNTQELLTKDWVGIAALEDKLEQVSQQENLHTELVRLLQNEDNLDSISIRDQVFACTNKRKDLMEKIQLQCNSKQLDIQRLQNKKATYPPHVEAAVKAIIQQYPQAQPCVLCDFIEITDPKWHMAIEGYIGGARFSIIVEPEYEAQAIRVVRGLKGHRNSARVIQGKKAQYEASKLPALPRHSIFEVMEFEHKIVEYYIKASYGNVVRVEDEETLRKTARGITAQGIGSGNYSMFRCDIDDAQLVFGQGARERALIAQQQQLNALQEQAQKAHDDYRDSLQLHEYISQVRPISCSSIIDNMLNVYRKLQKYEAQLDDLDLSDHARLEQRLNELKEEFSATETQASKLSEELGALNSRSLQLERTVDKHANEQEVLQSLQEEHEEYVSDISSIYSSFNSEQALKDADAKAQKAKDDFNFTQDNHDCLIGLDKYERQLYDTVTFHNQMNSAYNSLVYQVSDSEKNDINCFKHIVNLSEQIKSIHNRLKNNVLVGKHEKLASLKESFNTAFVTNLCHSIYQSINHGKQILDDLNKELEHHRFGADRERFYFGTEWVPEYKEYWRFFKEVIDIPNLGDGSTLFDAELSQKSQTVRDKLLSMLLDKDEQTALRELRRLSDYRNYRHYEIYKEPLDKQPIALSTYGTGSGGQLETPAYIIRSAAITSAFRFNEGSSHCRMVLVDEAFSKMDENRSREVIDYLTKTLGLQLIFIMPTSKSGPFMDLISHQVIFSKCPASKNIGELSTRVLVDRKVCNQEKIKILWSNHRKTIRQQAMLDFMEEI